MGSVPEDGMERKEPRLKQEQTHAGRRARSRVQSPAAGEGGMLTEREPSLLFILAFYIFLNIATQTAG